MARDESPRDQAAHGVSDKVEAPVQAVDPRTRRIGHLPSECGEVMRSSGVAKVKAAKASARKGSLDCLHGPRTPADPMEDDYAVALGQGSSSEASVEGRS